METATRTIHKRLPPQAAWMVLFLLPALALNDAHAQAPQLLRSHSGAGIGFAVADLPDIDGDGRRDFVTGAQRTGTVIAWSSASATPRWTVAPGLSSFGWSVADAGDLDGDGVTDVIAGGRNAPGGGAVRVLSGHDGTVLTSLVQPNGEFGFGAAVSGLDDLDGDGVPELLVGASASATALLYSGASKSILRTHVAAAASEFGAGTARLDDLDGDGVGDYVIGAPSEVNGRAFVHSGATGRLLHTLSADAPGRFGEFFVAGAGDVDADGVEDVYVGAYAEGAGGAAYVFSGRTGVRLYKFAGAQREGMGPGRSAGDVDGDGHADLIVGSYTYGGAGISLGGRVQIFSGADQRVLATINGSRPGAQFGFDAVGLGDVSGDGKLDFLISSPPGGFTDVYAGNLARPAVPAGASPSVSRIWWNPGEAGWGLQVLQQGSQIFATWYSYAPEDGKPMFLTVQASVAPGLRYSGPVYRVTGTPLAEINGRQAFVRADPVGSASLDFLSPGELGFSYSVFGARQSKRLQPFQFGAALPQCFDSTASRAKLSNVSDLWWNPRESGWGLGLAQQGEVLFALWYTYGQGGRDQWFSAARMERQPDGSFSGALQQPAAGVALPAINGLATAFPVPEVGRATLRFSDGENGVFAYDVTGVQQSKRIRRFNFSPGSVARPHCLP